MNNSLLFILFGISSYFIMAMGKASETTSEIKSSIATVHPDYNGDNKAELVFRDIDRGLISVIHSSGGTFFNSSYGRLHTDMPVIGDFDGDGITDLAIRSLGSATWKVKNSSGSNFNSTRENGEQLVIFGRQKQDIPAIGDYDGDGISDFAVFRPSTQMWYVRNSSLSNYNSSNEDGIQRVQIGDNAKLIPVPGDYDGDGVSDMALFDAESGNWIFRHSSQPEILLSKTFGIGLEDIPVVADYDGDGITDVAIWNRGSFTWRINESSTGIVNSHQFGFYKSDIPIVADYDGDGLADLALYSRSDSFVNIITSGDNQRRSFKVGGGNYVPVNAPSYLLMRLIEERDILLDTDGDGISDYEEIVVYNTSPILRDTDADGVSDYDEIYVYQTDPTNSDTDGDGLSDLIEVENSLEPGSATILPIDKLLSGYTYLGYGSAVREGFTVARAHLEFAFLADSRFPVYKFNADFSGWVSSPENSFSWSISDDDALVLNRFSGDAHDSFSDSTNPYNFHSVTPLDTIFDLSADDSGLQSFTDILNDIDNDNDFNNATATWYYQKTIKEIRLTPSTQLGDELNVEYTPTIEHRLSIPAEYRHYFAGKSVLVGMEQIHKDHSRSLIFASQNPAIDISRTKMIGDWVLPHIYQASAFELNFVDIVFSDDRHLNKLDRLTFTEQDASGEYSEFQFAWQVSQSKLILERNSERYEFRPFNRIGSRYQVEISHYDNNQLQRVYVGRLINVNDSAADFVNDPFLSLPCVHMEQHWHKDSIDEQGLNSMVSGYRFKENGSVDYKIRENSDVFQSLFNTPFSMDRSDNSVMIVNPEGVDIRWQVLDVDSSGLVTYLDVDRTIRDLNNNGVIDDFELDLTPLLSVKQLAVEDLSRYGAPFENSEFNFAATQTVTMRMNLPANVAGLDVTLFDPDDPNTFHASTSVTIYDSLGGSHIQTFYFIRQLDTSIMPNLTTNYWSVVSAVDGTLVNYTNADGINLTLPATNRVGHQSANNTVNNGGNGIAAGVLKFNANGEFDNMLSPDGIQSVNNATTPPLVNFTTFTTEALGGVFGSGPDATQQISINFNLNIDGKEPTQFASPFEVTSISQDGRAAPN